MRFSLQLSPLFIPQITLGQHVSPPPKLNALTVTKWVSHCQFFSSSDLISFDDLLPSASHPWRRQLPVKQCVIQFGNYRTMSNTNKCCSMPFTETQTKDNKRSTKGMASFFTFVEKCNVIRVLSVRTLSVSRIPRTMRRTSIDWTEEIFRQLLQFLPSFVVG